MPLLSLYCYAIVFLAAGYTISKSDCAVTCYPAKHSLSVADCTVPYNDALILNASMLNGGYWYSNVSHSLICQWSTCTLKNLNYKMSGIYTYHSGSDVFMINITILSPPYFPLCLVPYSRCGNSNSTCNQFRVDLPKTNYYHPRINVTVEGYGAANFSVQWYVNCTKLIPKSTNSSSSWSYGQSMLSPNKIQFYLEFPLLLLDYMAGDYMAVVSNAYGSNITHTEVLINRCYPEQKTRHVIKPSQGSSYQNVIEGEATDAIFEVLVPPNADLFICINNSNNFKLNSTQCSKCPYNANGLCTVLEDRRTWNVSIQFLNPVCLNHRGVTVHIPRVGWNDSVTIYLFSWVNNDDHSDGEIAHITILVKSKLTIIETILIVTAVVVLIVVIVLAILLGILYTRARRRVRLRHMESVQEEENEDGTSDVIPNMSGEDSKLLTRSREGSPSTGYGSFMDESINDDTGTIGPPDAAHIDLNGILDSKHEIV